MTCLGAPTVSNLQAFRGLLEDLNGRSAVDLPPLVLPQQQVQAIEMVRAAILRSAISLVVATLDPADRRGNRASLGEIVKLLKDEAFVEFLLSTLRKGRGAKPVKQKLHEVRDRYHEISAGQSFKRVRDLRHNAIAHLLLPEEPPATFEYSDVFALAGEIERLVISLYEGFGSIPPPQFLSFKEQTAEQAKLFWQTYFAGVAAVRGLEESRKMDDEYKRLRRGLDEARRDVVQGNRQRDLPPADMLALRNRAYKAWQALQIHRKRKVSSPDRLGRGAHGIMTMIPANIP
jgi:AbiU2